MVHATVERRDMCVEGMIRFSSSSILWSPILFGILSVADSERRYKVSKADVVAVGG